MTLFTPSGTLPGPAGVCASPFVPYGGERLAFADPDAGCAQLFTNFVGVAARRHFRLLIQFLRPQAHEVAVPGLARREFGKAQLFPDLAGTLHIFSFGQRERRKIRLARSIDEQRRLHAVVAARRMGYDHTDWRRPKRTIADDLGVFVRLRSVGDGPRDGDGVVRVDVFVDRDYQLTDAIAVIQNGLHGPPGVLVITLFYSHHDIGPQVNQRFHQ